MDIRNGRQRGVRTIISIYASLIASFSTEVLSESIIVDQHTNTFELDSRRLSNQELDNQRGGFIDVDGFKVNIGLDQVVLVDGVVVAQSSIVIPNIGDAVRQKVDQSMEKLDGRMAALDADITQLKNSLDMIGENLQDSQKLDSNGLSDSEKAVVSSIAPVLSQNMPAAEGAYSSSGSTKVNTRSNTTLMDPSSTVKTPAVSAPVNDMKVNDMNTAVLSMNDNTTTVIQNSVDNRVIQSLQVINMELSNIAKRQNGGIRRRLLPQIISSTR